MSGISIGELIGTLALNDQFSGPINKASKEVGLFSTSFGAITGLVGGAIGVITGATAAIAALGSRGAAVADVQDAFRGLTERAGESADVMLGALQDGTLGTISNFDLMKMANSALGTGLVSSSADMRTLAEGARLLADRTGGDTAEAFDTLTTAMAKGKAGGLKALGVFVDMKGAVDEHARSLGKNAGDLTQHERATAINAATLAALRREIIAGGPATADFGDQLARGKVMVENFTDSLGVAIATSPVIRAGLDSIGQAVLGAFGDSQKSLVDTLMAGINEFAISLTYVGQTGVVAAQVLVQGFYAIKTVVLGVITAVSGVVTGLVTMADGIVQMASGIPGASSIIGDLGAKTAELKAQSAGVTDSLREQTIEALNGAMGHSALGEKLDAVNGFLINTREGMEAAREATAGHTQSVGDNTLSLNEQGEALQATTTTYWEMMEAAATAYNATLELARETAATQTQLQQEIALANTSGVERRLLELDFQKQAELADLQEKLVMYPQIYDEISALVIEKYRIMALAAQGFHTNIVVQANQAGFQTRAQLEATAANAIDTYNRMKDSNQFTAAEMQRAWEAMEKAKQASSTQTFSSTTAGLGQMLTASASALQAFGVSYKAAAIAGAILSSISAIQKAWASAPFPANLPAVAVVTASTLANIVAIRSASPGFAMGTMGTRFQDFGRETLTPLHGVEAVVTKTQTASVASMVQEALKAKDDETANEIRGLREDMNDRDDRLPILLRDAALLAGV